MKSSTLTIVVSVGLYIQDPMIFALVLVIPPMAVRAESPSHPIPSFSTRSQGISSCLLLVRVGLDMATGTVTLGGTPDDRDESIGLRPSAGGRHENNTLSESAMHTPTPCNGTVKPTSGDVEAGTESAHTHVPGFPYSFNEC
jgi:hypothetical protein